MCRVFANSRILHAPEFDGTVIFNFGFHPPIKKNTKVCKKQTRKKGEEKEEQKTIRIVFGVIMNDAKQHL